MRLRATDTDVPDLYGDSSHLIATSATEDESVVSGIGIIDRGYGHFIQKLRVLGVNIARGG